VLEDLGPLLEDENGRAPDGADVDGLVLRVEHQHPAHRSHSTLLRPGARQRGYWAWLFARLLEGQWGSRRLVGHPAASV